MTYTLLSYYWLAPVYTIDVLAFVYRGVFASKRRAFTLLLREIKVLIMKITASGDSNTHRFHNALSVYFIFILSSSNFHKAVKLILADDEEENAMKQLEIRKIYLFQYIRGIVHSSQDECGAEILYLDE